MELAIIIATGVVAGVGLLIGLMLGVANKALAVETDERVDAIRAQLPGNNCGGCGYAGCDALAQAIVEGKAKTNACPVGGQATAEAIAEIMGDTPMEVERKTAFVRCAGTCEAAERLYDYYGATDCRLASVVPGRGGKACAHGCFGMGTCVKACQFDAIHIENGVAHVDRDKCRACGKCIEACPQKLIDWAAYTPPYQVACHSPEMGKQVKLVCQNGCLGCGLCARVCGVGAITVVDHLAVIDTNLCVGCGECEKKCPTGIIKAL